MAFLPYLRQLRANKYSPLRGRQVPKKPPRRRIRLEQLESRCLLAVVAFPDAYAILQDHPLSIDIGASELVNKGVLRNDSSTFDEEGSPIPLVASIVNDVQHGDLTLNLDGSFTYTPDADFVGTDTFEYEAVEDGFEMPGATATVTIQVGLFAVDDTFSTPENVTLTLYVPAAFGDPSSGDLGILANDSPADIELIHPVLPFTGPLHGAIGSSPVGGGRFAITYVPATDYVGPDSFTYFIQDVDGNTASATVTINVTGPKAVDDNYTTPQNTTLTVNASNGVLQKVNGAGQADSTPLNDTAVLIEGPLHGQLTLNPDGSFTYIPNANFNGQDGFRYRADDLRYAPETIVEGANIATVFISVPGFAQIDQPDPINEGSAVNLSGSATISSGNLEYVWDIDPNPNGYDPSAFHSPFEPDFSNAISTGNNPNLHLTWAQLNAFGIVNGQRAGDPKPIITLKVINHGAVPNENDPYSDDYAFLDISDVSPLPSVFSVTPAGPATCAAVPYHMEARFSEPNPLDGPLRVFVDWNLDFGPENPFTGISPDAVELFDFQPEEVDESGFPQFSISADHNYTVGGSKIAAIWVVAPGYDFGPPQYELGFNFAFFDVTLGGGEAAPPTVTIGGPGEAEEGDELTYTSSVTQNCASAESLVYAWTVTKDGVDVTPATGTTGPTFTFTPDDGNTPNTPYVVSLAVTDAGGSDVDSKNLLVTNVAPTLGINGATSVNEGSIYTLNLSSSDPGADTITSWTINWGDGTQTVSGNPSSVTHTYADGTPTSSYTISATATDEDGTFAAGNTVAVTVNNLAPLVAPITGPDAGVRYQTLSYSSSFSDVPADADATTAWTVLNSAASTVASGSGTSFDFTPTATGTYTVSFTVNDQDGGVTTVSLAPVTISATLVQTGVLYVGGTASNDTFNFTQTAVSQFSLVLNGANAGTFLAITEVRLFGGAGAGDAVTINGDSNTNAFEVRSDRLVLDTIPFVDMGIETRTLNALGSGDSITVFGGSATVNGGSAIDTLTMVSGTNDWHFTANNAGSINAGQIVFTSIEHLVGGVGQDTFRFDNGVGVSSDVEGGGDMDTLSYAAYTSANSVNLQSGNASHTGGISGIENFVGGAGNDTLTGLNAVTSWNLSGSTGSLSGGITFTSFENLQGGNQADTFNIQAGASTTPVVDGNGGDDVLSYSSYDASVTVNLATSTASAVGSFASILVFVGSAAADTLIGRNSNSTWAIGGVGSGSVGSTAFSSFESLQGGTANDTFRVSEGVSSGIAINGGSGTDKLDYAAYSNATNVNVDLGAGTATGFGGVSDIENVAGGAGNDVIRGDNNANMLAGNQGSDIVLGGGGNDTINGNVGRDILIGGDGADTIIGNADEDILIAGTTSFDNTQSALAALLAEWTSAATYAQRTGHIMGGSGGLNGSIVLNGDNGAGQTVFNDSNVDTLTGSAGVDWYFANQDGIPFLTLDIITDKTAAELWNDTDF